MPGASRRLAILCSALLFAVPRLGFAQTHGTSDDLPIPEHALRPLRVEVLGSAGFGDVRISTGESVNSYGPGFTLRAAWRFGFGATFGLRWDHFLGTSSEYSWTGVARLQYATGATFPLAELGYELLLPHAFVRPHVAVGAGSLRRSVQCNSADGSFHAIADQLCADADRAESAARGWAFAVAPGLTMGLRTGRFHAMVEPRYYVRDAANAFAIAAGVGFVF